MMARGEQTGGQASLVRPRQLEAEPVSRAGAPEVHTLLTNAWMYWNLNLGEDAAAVIVQLNRTAGDPVLFLKPAGEGFQVRMVGRLPSYR